jgi:hypothetical protein
VGHVTFRCGGCRARLKAPQRLCGQARPCPGCGLRLVVVPWPREGAGTASASPPRPAHAAGAMPFAGGTHAAEVAG